MLEAVALVGVKARLLCRLKASLGCRVCYAGLGFFGFCEMLGVLTLLLTCGY